MKQLRTLLSVVLAAVFLASTAMALTLALDYRAGTASYDEALALAVGTAPTEASAPPVDEAAAEILPAAQHLPEPEAPSPQEEPEPSQPTAIFDFHAPWLADLDLDELQAVNADVIGWILIPGTGISYPIVQGTDNNYYLNHTWDGQRSATGAVFMEATHAADFSGFSTILYGHNLSMGQIFRPLHKYRDQSFWEANPYVYIVTDAGSFRYRIYAAYEADITGTTYWSDVTTTQRQREYVQYGLDRSVLNTGTVPAEGTPVLTLSTCTDYTYARRWVVQAVLEGPITADLSQAFLPQ